jgi:hypothetical protein
MFLEMTDRGPDHAPAGPGPSAAEPATRLRGRRRQDRRQRRGPLITPAGWAFLGAMLASAALWATFIAIVVMAFHHHPAGRGS